MNLNQLIKKLFKPLIIGKDKNTPFKIKLVAIAMNEAAYLSEWIFHHLHFGFNHIEIHVNNTSDNTDELINKLTSLTQVKFIDADEIFSDPNIKFPQMQVYQDALSEGQKNDFTHVMFLDIDEFWLPVDFTSSIYDCIKILKGDVISFEWLLKYQESTPFSPVLPSTLVGKKSAQLKSIVKTGLQITFASPHNMVVPNGSNMLADGTIFNPTKENFSIAPEIDENAPVKDYFVLHRMFRSEHEYVAMLGRTNPFKRKGFNSTFKDNRFGYDANDLGITVVLPQEPVLIYNEKYEKFKQDFDLNTVIKKAQNIVFARKKTVLQQIENAPLNEERTLKKILRNLQDQDTVSAWTSFKTIHKLASE